MKTTANQETDMSCNPEELTPNKKIPANAFSDSRVQSVESK